MIPVFAFTIVLVLYMYVLTKFIESDGNALIAFVWALVTFGFIGTFMWWVFV